MRNFINATKNILIYLILTVVTSIPLEFVKDSVVWTNVVMILSSAIITFVIFVRAHIDVKYEWKDFKRNFKKYLSKSFVLWVIGFALMFVTNFIIVYLNGSIANNEELNREILNHFPIYSILSLIIFAPIMEEIMFRYNFKTVTSSRIPFVLLTGILFGFMHVILNCTNLIDLIYIIPYSCLGAALGAIYYDTQNIFVPIIIHSFHNLLMLIMILLNI